MKPDTQTHSLNIKFTLRRMTLAFQSQPAMWIKLNINLNENFSSSSCSPQTYIFNSLSPPLADDICFESVMNIFILWWQQRASCSLFKWQHRKKTTYSLKAINYLKIHGEMWNICVCVFIWILGAWGSAQPTVEMRNKNYTLTFAILILCLCDWGRWDERDTTKCFNFTFPALLSVVFHF